MHFCITPNNKIFITRCKVYRDQIGDIKNVGKEHVPE